MFDDDIWDNASSPAQFLAAYMADSRLTAPVLLAPPSRKHPGWMVTPADSADSQLYPKQIFLSTSSVSVIDALDDLCSMMARMSLQDNGLSRTPRPASPQSLDDVCRLLGAVSFGGVLDVEQGATPVPLADFGEPYSTCTDDESLYDGSSDATYVEEDSVQSWTTVCEEHAEEVESAKKRVTLHGTLGELASSSEKRTISMKTSPFAMDPCSLMAVDAATAIASLGLHPWSLASSSASSLSLFAPALRTYISL